jgi:predicted nucleotidyltransferase
VLRDVSADSARLRAVAARYAQTLDATTAVAVTGSAGRGDAEPSSDLDLWVISDDESVTHDVFEGVPISVMRESEARVLEVEHLAGLEVDITHVVQDPAGVFARVLALYEQHAAAIRNNNIAGARERLSGLLEDSLEGTPQGRLWALRAAAHLAAALHIYEGTGRMMPKLRHLRTWLPPDAYRMLRDVHGIDEVAPRIDELVRASETIAERMNVQLARLTSDPLPIATPHNALLKLAHGDIDDGVLLLRSFFETNFVDQVLEAAPEISMVRFLFELCDPQIRVYWQLLHGYDKPDAELTITVAATRQAAHALLAELADLPPAAQ